MNSSRSRRWRTGWAAAVGVGAIVAVVGAIALDRSLVPAHARVADDPAPTNTWIFLPLGLSGRAWAPGPVPTAQSSPTQPPASPSYTPAVPPRTTPPPLVNECAAPDPDWIFCDSFEEGGAWDGSIERPTTIAEPGPHNLDGNHAAQLRVPPGSGGHGIIKHLPEHDRLYARWYVQWEPGHDIAAKHHGPGGLAADVSWYLGRSGIRPNGDEYFVSTLEPSTQPPHVMYAYTYSRGMYMDCADPNGRCWGDHFPCYAAPRYCTRPQHLPKVEQSGTETGTWYCFEQLIDAGTPTTDAEQRDGRLNFWIDELEIGPWTDLWWRTVPSLKVNRLWLYLYHHEAHSEPGILVDNVVVSTSRIGCD